MLIRRKKTPGRSKWLNRRRKVTGGWPAVLFDDLRRAGCICLFVIVGLVSFFYICEVLKRSSIRAWISVYSVVDGGRYLAKYAYLSREEAILRIYDGRNGDLLAERTFLTLDSVKLQWGIGRVWYTTFDKSMFYDGYVDLPPSLLDRILAHTP